MRAAMMAMCLSILPGWVLDAGADERSLRFYHTHTEQNLEVTYYRDGAYVPEAMDRLRVFLADWRDGEQMDIDPRLMDILWKLRRAAGSNGAYEVISAYRSPATNAYLRERSGGVARNSMHMKGKAIDVRLRGVKTERLRQIAIDLKLGGVGYYRRSDFVHLDTGRVRKW
jgi:uncharacterized protein YcbK (DUF882 family)